MVAVGETMRFVTDGLQEAEARMFARKFLFNVAVRPDDVFMAFGEADHHDVRHADFAEDFHADAELPRTAVENDKIRQGKVFLQQPSIAACEDFPHEGGVVVGGFRTDAETSVVFVGRTAVFEADHGADGEHAGDVGHVETFHDKRRFVHVKRLLEGFDGHHIGRRHPRGERMVNETAVGFQNGFEIGDHVTNGGGTFEIHLASLFLHVSRELFDEFAAVATKDSHDFFKPFMVLLRRDFADAWAEAVANDIFMAMELRVRAWLRHGTATQTITDFKKTDGRPQGGRPWERAEIVSSVFTAEAGCLETRVSLRRIDGDMEIAFVIPQFDVVSRIVLLDETILQQEGFLLRFHRKDFVAGDAMDEGAAARIALHGARWLEIGAHPTAQIAGLADVNHFTAAISIDIDAWHARDVLAAEYGLF